MSILQELLHQADQYKNQLPVSNDSNVSFARTLQHEFIYSQQPMEETALSLAQIYALRDHPDLLIDHPMLSRLAAAYDYILSVANLSELVFSEAMIQQIHGLLSNDPSTHYRTREFTVTDTGITPPAASELTHLMSHYVDQIMSSRFALHPIELAAMAHRRLLDLHPYDMANGATAHLVMNYILLCSGFLPICIPSDQQTLYLEAIANSRRLDDLDPFSIFIASHVIETGQKISTQITRN